MDFHCRNWNHDWQELQIYAIRIAYMHHKTIYFLRLVSWTKVLYLLPLNYEITFSSILMWLNSPESLEKKGNFFISQQSGTRFSLYIPSHCLLSQNPSPQHSHCQALFCPMLPSANIGNWHFFRTYVECLSASPDDDTFVSAKTKTSGLKMEISIVVRWIVLYHQF